MTGFVVTCVEGGHRRGLQEIMRILEISLCYLQEEKKEEAQTPHTQEEKELEKKRETIAEQLARERKEMKKSHFILLGGNRSSDVLFIRNDSPFSEIELYNVTVQNTKRAQFIRRIIPVQSIFTTTVENLRTHAKKVSNKMRKDASFCIRVSKRLCSHISSEEIIDIVAKEMPYKVDLKTPDFLLVVEVSKDLCAMSLLKPCPGNFNITRNPIPQCL
ncbi:tRNA acetyltransferase TAN1 [Nematocida sp. LUAm3]|nr:tRNA acetyltransferase TAN1 [Nematocida sp. LUAm3]KAI5176179.1 tRNA acetyltransferase TAN1 [Nematocida sp. LUAm2]KAI5179273.1 tRNA acetyltransferase TAN1 [Nematocida sp. LUAm1]